MTKRPHEDHLPEDLQAVAARLSEHRADVDPLRLDHLKQRALTQATARKGRNLFVRSRLATLLTSVVLLGGAGGALAISNSDHHADSHGGAAGDQYRPGKGCGDKNHVHARHDECNKDDQGGGDDQGGSGEHGGGSGNHGGSGDKNSSGNQGSSGNKGGGNQAGSSSNQGGSSKSHHH